jgi:hypothetical protein
MRRRHRRHRRHRLQAHHARPQRRRDRRKTDAADRHVVDRLRQVLLKAVDRQRYHFRHIFERVEQEGNGVRVHFANGRRERAVFLVACDGFRSSVRGQIAPDVQPIYSGYYIWRGAPNESDLSPETRRTVFPYYSFFLGDQLQVLGDPISGADDELRPGQLGVGIETDEDRRLAKLLQSPKGILDWIAVPDFLAMRP